MTIDLQLVQDIYTQWYLYDISKRLYSPNDIISIDSIEWIETSFTNNDYGNIIFRFRADNKAEVVAISPPVEGVSSVTNGSGYLNWSNLSETLLIELDGVAHTCILSVSQTSLTNIVTYLNDVIFTGLGINADILAEESAGKLTLITTSTGESANIKILSSSTALDSLGLMSGNFRGNDVNFTTVLQEYFIYKYVPTDFDSTWSEIIEGNWVINHLIKYNDGGDTYTTISNYNEFTYRQTETYRSRLAQSQTLSCSGRVYETINALDECSALDMGYVNDILRFEILYNKFKAEIASNMPEMASDTLILLQQFINEYPLI